MNIEVMKAMLDNMDINFDVAHSGSMALQVIKNRMDQIKTRKTAEMYKIILLDYSMPDMDGPEVATLIREIFNSDRNNDYIK